MAETPDHQGETSHAGGHTRENIPSVGGPPSSTIQQSPPSPPEHRHSKKRYCRWTSDPAIFFVNLLGVGVVAAYTTVAYLQLVVMQAANMDAHNTAIAARDSAKAALTANATTRAQLAAYLTIQSPETILSIGNDGIVAVDLYVANSGGTPAREMYISLTPIIKQGSGVNFEVQEWGGPIEVTTKVPWHHVFDFQKIPASALPPSGGNLVVTATVAITYETIFKEPMSQTVELVGQFADPRNYLLHCRTIADGGAFAARS